MPWNFDNSYVRELQGFYAPWQPSPPPDPSLLVWNAPLASRLGLGALSPDQALLGRIIAGAEVPPGAEPVALAYAGHQFGHFSPQLGDGRALLVGEQIAPDGARFDIQLKGAGRTPFSRNGDGKYALGPALREHLVSEAMAALGIATTRSLGIGLTGEQVMRQQTQPGAVLARVAQSHIRVGTFQFFAAHLGADYVRRLADYTIARHYPPAAHAPNPYLALFEQVMEAQIQLVASWVQVGFVHGVMNTDNVAVSGETIDFGPCAFLDGYAAQQVFSSIDHGRRYAFGNQPHICRWNLVQFASSLAEIIAAVDPADIDRVNERVQGFAERYQAVWLGGMRRKLGLLDESADDLELANTLFAAMEGQDVDYTNLFRNLAQVPLEGPARVVAMFRQRELIEPWLAAWQKRIAREAQPAAQIAAAMNAVNPLYIPRNHKVEEALAAAEQGHLAPFRRLLEVVTDPYVERDDRAEYARPAPASFGPYVTFCGT